MAAPVLLRGFMFLDELCVDRLVQREPSGTV